MWRVLASLVVIFTLGVSPQDIMFPEDDMPTERMPVVTDRIATTPEKCKTNMFRYKGDDVSGEGFCDCIARYLYYQENDTCYEAYRQGPCPPQNYFVLPPGQGAVPKCESNPCLEDGLVPYNNTCSKVKSAIGPCGESKLLAVNSTFQLECVPANVGVLHIIDVPANRCPNGSRRNALGQCRKMI